MKKSMIVAAMLAMVATGANAKSATDSATIAKNKPVFTVVKQNSIDKNSQADYREKLNAELEAMRNKEMWQAGVTVRKLRPENN